jgi:two-component system cell cycle response regulator
VGSPVDCTEVENCSVLRLVTHGSGFAPGRHSQVGVVAVPAAAALRPCPRAVTPVNLDCPGPMTRGMPGSPLPRFVRVTLIAMAAWVVGLEASAIIPSHPGLATVFGNWPTDGVQMLSAALCAAAAMRQRGRARLAWGLMAAAIAVWTLGDVYWITALAESQSPPVPSPADIGYLLFEPLVFAGLVILLHAQRATTSRTVIVDGIVVALAAATVSVAFVLEPVAAHASGGTLAVATNLAYPIGDLALLGVIFAAVALRGWRLNRAWGLLGAGTLAFFVADSFYLVTSANGTYAQPTIFDVGWVGSTLLFAAAAWAPAEPAGHEARAAGTREIVLPLSLAFVAIMVTLFQPHHGAHAVTLALGAACTTAVMVRLVMTFRENVAMLSASRAEALTDALTGLGNRRGLAADLEHGLQSASDGAPLVLALFDLDGFKYYNDSFGHEAGDALLARLGDGLRRHVGGRGHAYRVGGDEFCALISPGTEIAQTIIEAAAGALTERGEGFDVSCSYGVVVLPREADGPADALRLADQRMYAAKHGGRASAGHQSKDVLLRAMHERDAELGTHLVDVASLADSVAQRLGLDIVDVGQVRNAAELHDIGKVAIPDVILQKPGPLDAGEWEFIHEHTIIGERIVAAAPSLTRVAAMIRSSHERFDGRGYPDGLVGTDIPLGARIIAICDAFDAMVTERSYKAAIEPAAALAELRRCAGQQFDPVVVAAFADEWAARARDAEATAIPS